MDLMHNQTILLRSGPCKGLYRVLTPAPELGAVIAIRIADVPKGAATDGSASGGRKAAPRRKPHARPSTCRAMFLPNIILEEAERTGDLQTVEIVLEGHLYDDSTDVPNPHTQPKEYSRYARKEKLTEDRKIFMAPFLDPVRLTSSLLKHGDFSDLVRAARGLDGKDKKPRCSKGLVYKCLTLLANFGFVEESLSLRYDKCGAPGQVRPCDPVDAPASGDPPRKKAGRKTDQERQQAAAGESIDKPRQPGMNSIWRAMIIAGYKTAGTSKRKAKRWFQSIINRYFVKKFKNEGGELTPVWPELGTYPNIAQARRVIEIEFTSLERLRDRTTQGHFKRSLRAIPGRSWEGVSGPNHTWAIDSSVGDVYLRSSLNRNWIIGRPIVYVVVDVWSTAVVGFYVCLSGPSWDMAKLAVFSAAAEPQLMANLWGYEFFPTLFPSPTLPAVLMCDRGEYLSKAARLLGMQFQLHLSYAPPYRPDLKGLVEVLHRIGKDEQYEFVPGSIDARQKEMERRRFDPKSAVLTVREYVHFLHWLFIDYNLTANRRHRIDDHMAAAGVVPSPAGLWRWGHQSGIGILRSVPQEKLIADFLPKGELSITGRSCRFMQADYKAMNTNGEEWHAQARNFGAIKRRASFFPGSMSRIWTPDLEGRGFLELELSDHSTSTPETTFDEKADATAYSNRERAQLEHERLMRNLNAKNQQEKIIAAASEATAAAAAAAAASVPGLGDVQPPNMTEARRIEVAGRSLAVAEVPPMPKKTAVSEEDASEYEEMMASIFAQEMASA